ncbi:MAG: peptidoglycan DD-metalloendopeptidase family protein [Nitrospirota bacterium]|nr:peptidoglycan DD-metalloendopeptidase family protein [Nitrospirota bacterium]
MYLAALLILALACPSISYAAPSELDYKKIQEKIDEEKRKLSAAQKREASVLNELDDVNKRLNIADKDLRKYRSTLKQTEAAISSIAIVVDKIKRSLERQKNWIKRKLLAMNRLGYGGDTLTQVLSAEDMTQLMRTWKYLEQITLYEQKILKAYRENLQKLDSEQKKLEGLRLEFKRRQDKVKATEMELAENKREKETILHSVRTEKATRQKMIAELKEASRRMLEIIRESTKTDEYEGKGFAQLKGRLLWPAEGKIAIPYGSHKDPQFDTPVFRNGIHIQTESSTDARSVYGGKVIFAEWFKGFGQLVIINHGSGYHTLYGNLSEIFSKVGDIIKENQVIGKVGTSGVLNAQGIYFEIRYKGKPLDPVQWLKKIKR